jgi:N-methylhydantoinase A/oxoprolinase/acetone carboxylase beta subunit
VLGGAWAGSLSGRSNVITFDVGGTSADIGIVTDGGFAEATSRDTWIAGFPVLVPMIDVHTIGAGGGSIAWIDPSGAFRGGPTSAGASPGPAAYGRGGTEPTVTDAHVVLGRLGASGLLAGRMTLDIAAAGAAVGGLAERLGLPLLETAEGILTLVNANMANAILSRTVQKGIDPRDYTLVAFGGAGPLHGAAVAAQLDIGEVIVPPHPGINSAVGLLTTDLKYDAVRTAFQLQGGFDIARLAQGFASMESALAAQLAADGVDEERRSFARAADVRYAGQGYELRIPIPPGAFDAAALTGLIRDFHARHEVEYGHRFEDSPVEIVNVRVTARGAMPKLAAPSPAEEAGAAMPEPDGTAVFRTANGLERLPTLFCGRGDLPVERPIAGPAVIAQLDATTVVPPGATVVRDRAGNLVIRLEGLR